MGRFQINFRLGRCLVAPHRHSVLLRQPALCFPLRYQDVQEQELLPGRAAGREDADHN